MTQEFVFESLSVKKIVTEVHAELPNSQCESYGECMRNRFETTVRKSQKMLHRELNGMFHGQPDLIPIVPKDAEPKITILIASDLQYPLSRVILQWESVSARVVSNFPMESIIYLGIG